MINRRLIVVLGMHRSGTSAITSGLEAIGVDLGDNLIPPIEDVNKKGFFEDAQINSFNNELLSAVGSSWHALSLITDSMFAQEEFEKFKLRAIELIQSKAGKGHFGLKDPRISRLLPFWQSVFDRAGMKVSYVIAVRNPMSVAASLQKRDGFEVEKSYYLWLTHMLPAVLQTQGRPRVVVNFDSLMADPQGQLKRIAQALDLPYENELPAVKKYASEFLDNNLRHAQYRLEDLREDIRVPSDVVRLHELLLGFANDGIDPTETMAVEMLGQLNGRLLDLAPALKYMTRVDKTFEELSLALALRDSRIEGLNQTLASRDSRIDEILKSKSWLLTKPFRFLRRKVETIIFN